MHSRELFLRMFSGVGLLAFVTLMLWLPPFFKTLAVLMCVGGLWAEGLALLWRQVLHPRVRPVVSYGKLWGAFLIVGAGSVCAALAGLLVISLLSTPEGEQCLMWVCPMVWLSDMGAYGIGKALGGPRLAPRLSPNKTWSGALGGFLSGWSWGMGYLWVSHGLLSLWHAGVMISVLLLAQAGDLAESAAKRFFGVKDSASLIPGHGGLWDRLDGLIMALLGLGVWLHVFPKLGF